MPRSETLAPALTVAAALRAAATRLGAADDPRLDAEILLAHCLEVPRTQLYMEPRQELDHLRQRAFAALVDQRSSGVPLPYLTGTTEFWSLPLAVTPAVLVPRPETELLVECALALAASAAPLSVIDLGTGSGAIAAAFASERGQATVVACDRSAACIDVAKNNFSALGLAHIVVLVCDWLEPFADAVFDLVLANPPYIGRHERAILGRELDYEPPQALFAGDAGEAALAAIARQAPRCLKAGGHVIVEHGFGQGQRVRALLGAAGFSGIETHRDLGGHERVTLGRKA